MDARSTGLAPFLGILVVISGCRRQAPPVAQPRILVDSAAACTLEDLRRLFRVGARTVYVQQREDHAPETTQWTVTSVDEDGFEQEVAVKRRSGTATDTIRSAWQVALDERTYPPGTVVTEETVTVPAGRFLCDVYRCTVQRGDSAVTKRTCYAREHPGLRVASEIRYSPGDASHTLRLVSWDGGPG